MSKRGSHGGADSAGAAPGGRRHEDKRPLPRARDQRSDVLRLEEEVRRAGTERVARAQAAARGELQAQAAGRGSLAGPAHAAGDRPKKAVRPRHRRELGRWTQAAFVVSERRVSRLLPIQLATLRYRSRRDPQTALRMRLRELAANRVRFGYRRLTVLLQARRMGGERQAHLPAIHRGRAGSANQAAQEDRTAPTSSVAQGDSAAMNA